jgi:hypothetical protein
MVPPNVVAVLATAAVALTVRFVASRRGTPESSDPASNDSPGEEEEEEEEEDAAAAAAQQKFGKKRDFVVEPTTITWHNITCVLLDKADKVVRIPSSYLRSCCSFSFRESSSYRSFSGANFPAPKLDRGECWYLSFTTVQYQKTLVFSVDQ